MDKRLVFSKNNYSKCPRIRPEAPGARMNVFRYYCTWGENSNGSIKGPHPNSRSEGPTLCPFPGGPTPLPGGDLFVWIGFLFRNLHLQSKSQLPATQLSFLSDIASAKLEKLRREVLVTSNKQPATL
jgi:hypothetical protein